MAVVDDLVSGFAAHLQERKTVRKVAELVASAIDLDVLDGSVGAVLARAVDGARLVGTGDLDRRTRRAGRVT